MAYHTAFAITSNHEDSEEMIQDATYTLPGSWLHIEKPGLQTVDFGQYCLVATVTAALSLISLLVYFSKSGIRKFESIK